MRWPFGLTYLALTLALGREAPELHGACVLVLLRGLEAEGAEDSGEVRGRAADLGREFGRHGEGRGLGCPADLGDGRCEALGEVGAHRARTEADLARRVEQGVGPGAFLQREGGLRGNAGRKLAGMYGA